jgi:hypothetical protein
MCRDAGERPLGLSWVLLRLQQQLPEWLRAHAQDLLLSPTRLWQA